MRHVSGAEFMTTTARMVYRFGDGEADGTAKDRELLGGKGANLAEMCQLGVPVPPGFTITTQVCTGFYANNRAYPDGLEAQVADAVKWVGGKVGAVFGDAANPLLPIRIERNEPGEKPAILTLRQAGRDL